MSIKQCSWMILFFGLALYVPVQAQTKSSLQAGKKVFITEMPDDFDTYLRAAMAKKRVPLVVVESKDEADFEITGTSETHKAGKAKKILRLNWHSAEQASIAITDLLTGEVVFAYSVNKESSAHGKRSTAEACAKHIKKALK
jgi:hypothetical protein